MARSPATGDELFGLVTAYASLGDHRTATPVDDRTRDWLTAELRARGARVGRVPYEVPRFDAEIEVRVAGSHVPAEPLWYSGTTRLTDAEPAVLTVELVGGIHPAGLEEALATAMADRPDGVVVFLRSAHGGTVGVNRSAGGGPGVPAALAGLAGDTDPPERGAVRLDWKASVTRATSETVVGRFGDAPDPFVVTTPLTGWYRCAGERGTGIAIALDLAETLSRDLPVLVVATTGHELDHLGAKQWLRNGLDELRPRAVLHLGASVAAAERGADGRFELAPMRFALTTLEGADRDALAGALASSGLPLSGGPPRWPGEGDLWRHLGAPVLSLTGASSHFHRPTDEPANATSPALLEQVRGSLVAAARLLARR